MFCRRIRLLEMLNFIVSLISTATPFQLTGLWPFYDDESKRISHEQIRVSCSLLALLVSLSWSRVSLYHALEMDCGRKETIYWPSISKEKLHRRKIGWSYGKMLDRQPETKTWDFWNCRFSERCEGKCDQIGRTEAFQLDQNTRSSGSLANI